MHLLGRRTVRTSVLSDLSCPRSLSGITNDGGSVMKPPTIFLLALKSFNTTMTSMIIAIGTMKIIDTNIGGKSQGPGICIISTSEGRHVWPNQSRPRNNDFRGDGFSQAIECRASLHRDLTNSINLLVTRLRFG